MCGLQGVGDPDRDSERIDRLQRSAADAAGQRFTFQVFHDEEAGALVLAEVVQRANVRVRKLRNGPRFALKTGAKLRVECQIRRQDLQRDDAIEASVDAL